MKEIRHGKKRHNLRWLALLGMAALFMIGPMGSGSALAYENWKDNGNMTVKQSTTKVKVRGKVTDIPVFHLLQENCIFIEAEDNPSKFTSLQYKRPDCVKLRNKRVQDFSNGENPPAETKIFRVPANQWFKISMTISTKMKNRGSELFGFQVVKKGAGSKSVFIQGGWKVGETKLSKAIKLEPGLYYWRCPQNPTPWYGMIVE